MMMILQIPPWMIVSTVHSGIATFESFGSLYAHDSFKCCLGTVGAIVWSRAVGPLEEKGACDNPAQLHSDWHWQNLGNDIQDTDESHYRLLKQAVSPQRMFTVLNSVHMLSTSLLWSVTPHVSKHTDSRRQKRI